MAETAVLLSRLQDHLHDLTVDPAAPPDAGLLEECEHVLVPQLNDPQKVLLLVSSASVVLSTTQKDPTSLAKLLQRLVDPFSFLDVLNLEPSVDFVAGLDPKALPYNGLVLSLIAKAAKSTKETAMLANMSEVTQALVRLWLSSSDIGTADTAGSIILELLTIDKENTTVGAHGTGDDNVLQSGGQGLMWRRIFDDKDIYRLFYALTSLKSNGDSVLGKREKSLAQARLMSLLPRIGALDWRYISSSHDAEVERDFGLNAIDEGLIHWAAIHMVDYKDDVLIYTNLIQFYGDLLSMVRTVSDSPQNSSVSLDFLIHQGLHERASSFWLRPDDPTHDPLEVQFLYSYSARYVSTYLSHYPEAFLASQGVLPVLQRLAKALEISTSAWAHGTSPAHDLHVLSSIPRIALLPTRALGTGMQSSPILAIPSKSTNQDALSTLSHVFKGPDTEIVFPSNAGRLAQQASESATARALYMLYSSYHPGLFEDLLQHAETVALPQLALASIQLIMAIVSARWEALPTQDTSYIEGTTAPTLDALPTEDAVSRMLPPGSQQTIGTQGIHVLLQSPARERVFPWLLKPPTTYTHLVGGRGDPEGLAYQLATAKWDLLMCVKRRLQTLSLDQRFVSPQALQTLKDALEARIAEGLWGGALEAGSRIGTLEL